MLTTKTSHLWATRKCLQPIKTNTLYVLSVLCPLTLNWYKKEVGSFWFSVQTSVKSYLLFRDLSSVEMSKERRWRLCVFRFCESVCAFLSCTTHTHGKSGTNEVSRWTWVRVYMNFVFTLKRDGWYLQYANVSGNYRRLCASCRLERLRQMALIWRCSGKCCKKKFDITFGRWHSSEVKAIYGVHLKFMYSKKCSTQPRGFIKKLDKRCDLLQSQKDFKELAITRSV